MKNLVLLAISGLILLSSCIRYSQCTDPSVGLKYQLDSSGTLFFTFNTYEKGGSFSKLLSSVQDTAYRDTLYHNPNPVAKNTAVDDKYDYIVLIPETGKTYKISDISYSGDKKVEADGIVSENKTGCTRTVSYKVDGQTFTQKGVKYELHWNDPEPPLITITK